MSLARFTVTVVVDVEEKEFYDDYSGARVELVLTRCGVRVPKPTVGKIQTVRCDMTLGGMSTEEYLSKIHQQVHKDHNPEDEGGEGGATTH